MHEHFTGRFPWQRPVSIATIQPIHSEVLKEDRDVIVHLPIDYDSSKQYPVMYVLDGSSLDEPFVNSFKVLSSAGFSPSVIVVGIPNVSEASRQRDYTPPYLRQDMDHEKSPNGEADNFLTFMEAELISFIESKYSTSGYRLVAGHSRGGLLVMHSLIAKPDLFHARFCFSSPFWRQDQVMVSKVSDFLNVRDSLNSFLYLSVGENETDNMRLGNQNMTNLLQAKSPVGLTWFSESTPKANHQSNAELSVAHGIGKWISVKY
jgi:predicted alpha/beta superfamily hydrolase